MRKAENHPPTTTGKKEDGAFAVCREQEEAFRLGSGGGLLYLFFVPEKYMPMRLKFHAGVI